MTFVIDPDGAEGRVIHQLVDFRDKDVVEIGAGDGRLTWRYANLARSVLGIEPKAEVLALALEAMAPALRSKVDLRVGDVTEVELPTDAFDVAVFSRSL